MPRLRAENSSVAGTRAESAVSVAGSYSRLNYQTIRHSLWRILASRDWICARPQSSPIDHWPWNFSSTLFPVSGSSPIPDPQRRTALPVEATTGNISAEMRTGMPTRRHLPNTGRREDRLTDETCEWIRLQAAALRKQRRPGRRERWPTRESLSPGRTPLSLRRHADSEP